MQKKRGKIKKQKIIGTTLKYVLYTYEFQVSSLFYCKMLCGQMAKLRMIYIKNQSLNIQIHKIALMSLWI